VVLSPTPFAESAVAANAYLVPIIVGSADGFTDLRPQRHYLRKRRNNARSGHAMGMIKILVVNSRHAGQVPGSGFLGL
jgi:hypothetical protein